MKITFADVKAAAHNQWPAIHASLGIVPASRKKHCPCPGCGGDDRFRLTKDYDTTGGFICSQGGLETIGGDGFSLIQHALNYSPVEALKAVAQYLDIDGGFEVDKDELMRRRRISEKQVELARKIKAEDDLRLIKAAKHQTRYYLKTGTRVGYHRYLHQKGLLPHHAKNLVQYTNQHDTYLVVPIVNIHGEIVASQKIGSDGKKLFSAGPVIRGNFAWLDKPPEPEQSIGLCEGWATAASIEHAGAMAIAFNSGNMLPVLSNLVLAYPSSPIVIYADDDKAGLKAADDCQRHYPDVTIKKPKWPRQRPAWAIDYNDLMIIQEDILVAEIEREALAVY